MEVYLLNGMEVTLEELQAQADASEIDLETFKALYNVTTKTTTAGTGATAETGIASIQDADVKETNIVSAAETKISTDLRLEKSKSALQLVIDEKNEHDKRYKEVELIIENGGTAPEINAQGYMKGDFQAKNNQLVKKIRKLGGDVGDIENTILQQKKI